MESIGLFIELALNLLMKIFENVFQMDRNQFCMQSIRALKILKIWQAKW